MWLKREFYRDLGTLPDKRPNQGLSIQDFLQGRGGTNIQKVLSRRELYSTQHVTVLLNSLPQADVEANKWVKKELENNHWRTTYLDAKECMWLPTQEVLKLQRASNWKYMAGEVLLNKTICCYGLRCLIYSLRVLVIEYLSGETWEVQCQCPQPCFPKTLCVSLDAESVPLSGGRSTQMKKGHDEVIQDTPFIQPLPAMEPDC